MTARWIAALALGALLNPQAGWTQGYENRANKESAEQEAKADSDVPQKAILDVNTASKDELKSLPGMGEEFAQRVIDHRPYADVEELRKRKVLPRSVYRGVKDRITVNPSETRPVEAQGTR